MAEPAYFHKSVFDLYIAPSQIPSAGLGVYTRTTIPTYMCIDEYVGDVREGNFGGGYSLDVGGDSVIDAREYPRCYMAMINDCSFIAKRILRKGRRRIDKTPSLYYGSSGEPLLINVEFHIDTATKRAYVYSLTDIPANTELFVSYGPEYWGLPETKSTDRG